MKTIIFVFLFGFLSSFIFSTVNAQGPAPLYDRPVYLGGANPDYGKKKKNKAKQVKREEKTTKTETTTAATDPAPDTTQPTLTTTPSDTSSGDSGGDSGGSGEEDYSF